MAAAPLLSVAIITCNEEQNLARSLESLESLTPEIILVDSGSTDRTLAIAESFHSRILHHPWQGFAAQKNFALAQCTGTWVLSLDADEELTPELQSEIAALLQTNPAASAFRINRRNLFLGRWIRHGGFYPDPKLRLFRRDAALTFQDRPVHETLTHPGPIATLQNDLVHHAYPTLTGYLDHMNRYSTLGAELLAQQNRTSPSTLAFVTNTALIPILTFFWNFLFRLGFLDGREGLLLHLYHSAYISWKYAKAWHAAPENPAGA